MRFVPAKLAWICGALPLSVSAHAEPRTVPPAAVIKLESYVGDLLLANMTVDGVRARLLVDTGGGLTLLTPALAARTGCRPHGRLVARRMTGEKVEFQKCLPVRLAAGAYSTSLRTGVFDLMKLLPAGLPPLDGVLSLDSFDGQTIRLSLAEKSLSVLKPEVRPAGHRGKMSARRELPGAGLTIFVKVPAAIGDVDLLLDSANLDDVLLSPKALEQLSSKADAAVMPSQLSLRLHDGPPDVVQAQAKELEIDGALNARVMRRYDLTLDLKSQQIWFKPTAKGE